MKTATFPPLRVHPSLREDAESVLIEGETLSKFAETAIRSQVERRKVEAEFLARGLASRDKAIKTGHYISSQDVLAQLDKMLQKAKQAKK